jgi:hypothetical protein
MHHRHSFPLLLAFLISSMGNAGEVFLSGVIRDASTNDRLPAAIVRVLGTSRGTVCNSDGAYRLALPPGRHTLVVSSLGYRPDTVSIILSISATRDFLLIPSDIILPEIVVTGEDPARAIIRRAIANKKEWIERLRTYRMEAFTRQVLRRDTTIASITEAYTTGYWQQGDTLREVITQRRQTENIESSFNFASVGRLLNFYEDDIRFLGYSFVGPIADNAFDYYDYTLLRTRQAGGSEVHEIEMIPLSLTVPVFSGTVSIAGDTYALVGVDVEPNEAFLLPFVKEKQVRYRQQFALYENIYWLPADIRIDGRFRIGVIGFSLPVIGFTQTSVITDYQINIPLPDSVFRKPRLVVDSSAVMFDSSLWTSPSALPLTHEEERAYETLDSTQSLAVQFRPGGFAMTLGLGGSDGAFSLTDFIDLSFNRVEGAHAGVRVQLDKLTQHLGLRAGAAYGFSDKVTKYTAGFTVRPTGKQSFDIGFDYYRSLLSIPNQGYYGAFYNSLTSLLDRNDYHDYYMAKGWKASARLEPVSMFGIAIAWRQEKHIPVEVGTSYSLLGRSRPYRINPLVQGGTFKSLGLHVRLGEKSEAFDFITRNNIELMAEWGTLDQGFWSYDFARYEAVATFGFRTFGGRFLFPAGVRIRVAAGTSSSIPIQRTLSVETASSVFAPFGVMKAMSVKEFTGDRYVAANIEHNFRSLPFLALGIPFLYENNIEFIIHGGVASVFRPVVATSGLFTTEAPWYYEAGFGFSRIFEILRADFTWRLSQQRGFRFTLGVAGLM